MDDTHPATTQPCQDITQIPHALSAVLSHLSQHDRLCAAALASRAFKEAAMAATTTVVLKATPDKCAGMKQWLARYAREPGAQANEPTVLGHNVLRLELLGTADVEMSIRNMPFRALRQLRLHGLKVQLGPMNGHPGMLAAAEGLTWLSLEACELLGGSSSLLHLTALPALQHLEVTHNTVASRMASTDIPLSQLRRLTHLTLDSPFYGAQNIYGALGQLRGHGGDAATEHDSSTLAATSALTCLQELVVQGLHLAPSAFDGFQQLQHCLTKLYIKADGVSFSPGVTPALSTLTSLRWLHISNAQQLHPAVLSRMTCLEHLALTDTPLADGAMGTAKLLQVLPALQRLRNLEVKRVIQAAPPNPAAYTALTASSCLSRLVLQLADCGDRLAAADWACIFPSSQQQQQPEQQQQPQQQRQQQQQQQPGCNSMQLRGLSIQQLSQWTPHWALQELQLQLHLLKPPHSNNSSSWDLGALASCCPSLARLTVDCQSFFDAPVLAVHRLTQIKQLSINARRMPRAAAAAQVQEVAQLAQLRGLRLSVAAITLQDLRPLTALQRLTELAAAGVSGAGVPSCNLHLQALQEAEGPQVCVQQQLLDMFEAADRAAAAAAGRRRHP